MRAGGAPRQRSRARPPTDGRAAPMPVQPSPAQRSPAQASIDTFQTAFAAYLAGNLKFKRLRTTMSECVTANPYLFQVMARSFAAAFASECLSLVDYRVLKADLSRFRVAAQRQRNDGGQRKSIGAGSVVRNRFEILERVAVGGIGMLYRAIDRRRRDAGMENSTVAIKMLSDEFRHCPQALRSLQCEARSAQHLAHSNIRTVYDLDHCDAGLFITMEWLEGESLAIRLDRTGTRAMPWPAATRILTGVGAGLAHAHGAGIVHGDVKPGNVFVTVDGTIKLLDFGQANSISLGRRPAGKLSISPAYASCELHEGGRPEVRDDVFALAVMAYRIIAGARPFGRYTPLDAEKAGIQALRPTGMETAEWRMLQQGLSWRRAQRPESVAEFVAALLPKQSTRGRQQPTSLHVAA